MNKIKTKTLIIGAGPAGMACAMELAKAGQDFILIEKDSRVGGLSKTYEFKEGDLIFRTDNGPHRFFSKNPYLYEFIGALLGERWIEVRRQTRQFIDGKFYDYPVNLIQALKNVGVTRAIKMVTDYLLAQIRYQILRWPIINFEDYIIANFGRNLGEFNMINYTEKIWGIPAREIHIDWAIQRIKGVSLFSAVRKAIVSKLSKNKRGPKSMIDAFYYPDQGTGLIYEMIKDHLLNQGYKIYLSSEPIEIGVVGNSLESALVRTLDSEVIIEFENLVESTPINHFVKLLRPKVPDKILEAATKLRHRSQVFLFLTLNRDQVTKDQWIYFPSKKNLIGRVSEMKNFSSKMSPPEKSSLFVEFFCFENDEIWEMKPEKLFELALDELSKAGLIRKVDVRKFYYLKQANSYPLYDIGYKKPLAMVKSYLDQFKNLYYIGRPGRFRYTNQDHSLEMGILAAKSIINGERYDIEMVGTEQEYGESGSVPITKTS